MGSSSSNYQIPWPGFMQGMLDAFRVALMDVFQVTAVDCFVPLDFYAPYYFVTITTVCLLVLTLTLHRVLPRAIVAWFPHWEGNVHKKWRNLLVKGICIFMVRPLHASCGCVRVLVRVRVRAQSRRRFQC